MAILKIAKMGNEILKQVAEPVVDIAAENIAALAKDMKETLEDIGGNGLAAPQVHVSKRVVVYRITENQIPAGAQMRPLDWRVLVNPVVEHVQQVNLRVDQLAAIHSDFQRKLRHVAEITGDENIQVVNFRIGLADPHGTRAVPQQFCAGAAEQKTRSGTVTACSHDAQIMLLA